MSFEPKNGDLAEKHGALGTSPTREGHFDSDPETGAVTGNVLHQDLKGRHMQMIAM